jgi:regulator of sigma E protease
MLVSFLYVLLAVLGLSFLIFIHELGHYFMARRVGMRVETFSIGFGKPLFTWERDGVKWQICWLLLGGYVKIAGVDLEKDKNPYDVPDGFFGKSPIDRIKVAVMGPVVNLLFALLAFTLLWMIGGREKSFSDFTAKIGWVDPNSTLYQKGVRPGDEVTAYDAQSFQGAKDHLYAPMTAEEHLVVKGSSVDYATGIKSPFTYDVKTYPHPAAFDKDIKTAGILQSASYLLYSRLPNGQENPLPEGSPLQGSGIQYGDRIFWVNGETVFSLQELNSLLTGQNALLTVERNGQTLLTRVPRVPVQELRTNPQFKEELIDWQFEAGLNNEKIQHLYAIPYNLTHNCVVENSLKFIDREKQEEFFPAIPFSPLEAPLEPGDRILAINGVPVVYSYELLRELQTYRVNVIVERAPALSQKISWKEADQDFDKQISWKDLQKIVLSIGTEAPVTHAGNFYLLKPIIPKARTDFALSAEKQALLNAEIAEHKKVMESIEDSEKRTQALHLFEKQEKRLLLGLPGIQDKVVEYNPSPWRLFGNVFDEIWRTLTALFSGALNPKWMAGPIGIVQMVHDNSMSSIREGLYWLGAISLNLGVLNLLPIPVLDGGTILMSLIEIITRRRLHPKTMEKLILPFAVLLIAFFLFLTYNDLIRLFSKMWV